MAQPPKVNERGDEGPRPTTRRPLREGTAEENGNPLLAAARKALALGWSVIPVAANKKPFIRWLRYQRQQPTLYELTKWLSTGKATALAVVTGAISRRAVLDFDTEEGKRTMTKLGLKPHVRTGSGGFHVHLQHPGWRVRTVNHKTMTELGRRYPGMDIRADGGYAVFAGINKFGKYEWLRSPTPDALTILPIDLREFLGLLHAPQGTTGAHPSPGSPVSCAPRVSVEILIQKALGGVPGEGRNNRGYWLACQLRDNGYSHPEAEGVMVEYVQRVPGVNQHGRPEAYTRKEALASLGQAFRHQQREPWKVSRAGQVSDERSTLTNFGPAGDFFERQTLPREEIIEGILREKQLAAFAGPFNVGKSPLLADIIVHRVYEIPWCGHTVRRGPVTIVDLENERGAWSRNVRNIALRLGVPLPKVPDQIEVYLLNDEPSEPATRKLLDALESRTFDARFKLLDEALQRNPDALVIIDPVDLLFPIKKSESTQVLALFRKLKQLLSRFPQAAIILTFNLRKQDRRTRRASLLSAPRDWLEEIAGSLDLCNRSDVRIGIDFHDEAEGVRVINGVRRNEEMRPLLVRPVAVSDNSETLAGFDLVPLNDIGLRAVLTPRQLEHWCKLPRQWRFDEVADRVVPRASLSRIIRRVGSLALEEKDGVYRKLVD